MHVLVTPIGSAGDNFPLIGIGTELARRGHEVTVATIEPFEPLVRHAGLNYIQTGTTAEYREALNNPDIWHPIKGFEQIMKFLSQGSLRLYDVVSNFAAEHNGDVLVVAHFLDFASRVLQDKNGLPVVTVQLSPTVVRTVYQMPTMSGRLNMSWLPRWVKRLGWKVVNKMVTDRFAAPIVNELRARAALPPIRGIFDDWIHSPLLTVGMWPDWYAPPQPDHPPQIKLTSFPLFDAADAQPVPAEVEAFLAAGEPPVVFTPGSANVHARSFFETGIEACQRIGRRALLLTKYAEHVPPNLPGFALRSPFAPLTRLLPRCAALVHHGGVGTTAAGLAAGVPQIVWPLSHDQPDNAARTKRLGAGDRILPKHFKPGHVADVLNTLLTSPQIKQNCAAYASRLAGRSGVAEACDLIESLPSRSPVSMPAGV